jgi:hypothetical protein
MSPDDATTRVNCANAACTTCNPVCVPYVKAFPTDYFTSSAYYKGNPGGFMGALLAYYATANDPKSPNYRRIVSVAYGLDGCNTYYDYGAGSKICPTYYAYSDGKANFEFTLRDAAGFAGLPTSVSVPASYFGYVGTINGIWGIPFAPGATIADQIQFQMYKALAADLNRGVAMQTSWHGVAPCADPSRPPSGCPTYDTAPVIPAGLNYYRDTDLVSGLPAIYNGYAAILHDNFMGGFTYAQSYDDYWGQSTDIGTGEKPSNVEVTIESMRL